MPSVSFKNIWLVARREYLERVRAKSFLVMTILIPLLMGGLVGGSAYLNRNLGSAGHLAVVTDNPQFATDVQTEMTPDSGVKPKVDVYSLAQPGIRQTLDEQLKEKDGTLDGYLVATPPAAGVTRGTYEWVPKSKADVVTKSRIADAIRGALTRERLEGSGIGAKEVDSLLAPIDLKTDRAGGGSGTALVSAYGMFFLMYFVILFYGMNVARSIIEEKTSRIFEVLLATMKPTEMLAGKVIGVGAVGLTQVGIWIAVAVAAVSTSLIGRNVHLLPTGGQAVLFVVFFLLGYLLYSSIAAALGAMTNSEQELQQMQIFLMMPLILCSVIIFNVVTNPDGPLAKVFSFIPFTTPLIMYTRVIVGKPSPIAIGGSILEMMVTIALVLWISSRIYRIGILMYGKKPNLPEILRWLKYS
jgi:ABC-2 type transport system permease protein